MTIGFGIDAVSDGARAGSLATAHGTVQTPAFMPVATRGSVRSLDGSDLDDLGVEIALANTYHLMLRPGASAVEGLGGLHGFTGWPGPWLTDSGGYQVYSLEPVIDDRGALFRSSYDGSEVLLTPESAIEIQQQLGADIAMVLDVCVGLPAPPEDVAAGMHRTLSWTERAIVAHQRDDQALFGIVQGGVDPEMRAESARRTAEFDMPGYGIGGLSVGESSNDRNESIEVVTDLLPHDRPRYVMGLGDTEGVLAAVERGADLFDCVWPTRHARHGRISSPDGDYNLTAAHSTLDAPLVEGCGCSTCHRYTAAYLRHLLKVGEFTAFRLLSIHNLYQTLSLMRDCRKAILEDGFQEFRSLRSGQPNAT